MTAGLPDRAADRERECTCCPSGKRPAIEHAKGCPRRAARTVPLSASSVGEQIAALAQREAVARKLFYEFVTGDQAAWTRGHWRSEHHRTECYRVADELLALLAATRDGGQA